MTRRKLTLEQARAMYVHRFTLEHAPSWAREVRPDGTYYAPQFCSDQEWYDHTTFPGEPGHIETGDGACYTRGQTWPLGKALDQPYEKGQIR